MLSIIKKKKKKAPVQQLPNWLDVGIIERSFQSPTRS